MCACVRVCIRVAYKPEAEAQRAPGAHRALHWHSCRRDSSLLPFREWFVSQKEPKCEYMCHGYAGRCIETLSGDQDASWSLVLEKHKKRGEQSYFTY